MNISITELDLRGELLRLRERSGTQKISIAQAQALGDCSTPEEAVRRLFSGVAKLVNVIPEQHIEPYHPLIGAMSMLLNHAAANPDWVSKIDEARRSKITQAIKERNAEWDPGKLEWQLIVYIKVLGEGESVDSRLTLSEQEFEDDYMMLAWDVLMVLNILRMENRL